MASAAVPGSSFGLLGIGGGGPVVSRLSLPHSCRAEVRNCEEKKYGDDYAKAAASTHGVKPRRRRRATTAAGTGAAAWTQRSRPAENEMGNDYSLGWGGGLAARRGRGKDWRCWICQWLPRPPPKKKL